ncbi:hypothetical protein GY653_25895, partial [Escherichia coli]|uniref:hypothetical protein n=1 Tax=Escherichia coli TaxID=562 RepID=UPI0015C07C3E
GAQGFVQQALAGQTALLRLGRDRRLEPWTHGVTVDAVAFQEAFQGALGVLFVFFVDLVPDAVVQIRIKTRQDHAAQRRAG